MIKFLVSLIIFFIILIGILFIRIQNYPVDKSVIPTPISTTLPTPDPVVLKRLHCLMVQGKYDMDCSDFNSQEVANSFLEAEIDCFGYDKFRLDGDKDGFACESLPLYSD